MIDKLLNFFKTQQAEEEVHNPNLAAAALLVEIMHADHDLSDTERTKIKAILFDTLFLTEEVSEQLLKTAEAEVKEANDLFQFTDVINDTYSPSEKVQLIESLWKVAYADAQIDKYEEHMIRRISDLLHISHSDFMQCKHRVRDNKA